MTQYNVSYLHLCQNIANFVGWEWLEERSYSFSIKNCDYEGFTDIFKTFFF